MMKFYTVLAALLFTLGLNAQEESVSATGITSTYYLAYIGGGATCTPTTMALGASGSGTAVCDGTDNDDIWLTFNASTQGMKVDAGSTTFDAVLYVYDSGMTLVGCENSVAGTGTESLWITTLTPGDDYFIRIHSFSGTGAGTVDVCTYHLPPSELRTGWSPFPSGDPNDPGYRVTELTKRRNYAPYNNEIEATRWEFTELGSGDVDEVEITGNSGNLTLVEVPNMCYGNDYMVRVQIRVNGAWCGYGQSLPLTMEAEPNTRLLAEYSGATVGISSDIKVVFSGVDQLIEWRFTSNNGNEVLSHFSTSSTISIDDVACVRYDRVYTVEVRVTYCGITGPWSEIDFIIISQIPYTGLTAQYCGTVQFPGATLQTEFVNVADQYAWQLAPVDPLDPNLTPTGPAIVTYTNNTLLYLLPLGLEYGTTYRIGTKSFLGTQGGCNTTQESDYGNFCLVTIGNPGLLAPPFEETSRPNFDENVEFVNASAKTFSRISAYPNPLISGDDLFVKIDGETLSDKATVSVFNSQGQEVFNGQVSQLINGSTIRLNTDNNWAKGMYFLQITDDRKSLSTTLLI
ncbi:MAG: T9SS type A sorting domain-containing protein, partial [Flavobacteriales bacterium]